MFLYESLWNLATFFILVAFAARWWQRVPWGTVFALYVVLYTALRLPLETWKIDPRRHHPRHERAMLAGLGGCPRTIHRPLATSHSCWQILITFDMLGW